MGCAIYWFYLIASRIPPGRVHFFWTGQRHEGEHNDSLFPSCERESLCSFSWPILELDPLGAILGRFGGVWGRLGVVFLLSWAVWGTVLGPIWAPPRTAPRTLQDPTCKQAPKHPSKQTNRPTTKLPSFVPTRPGGMREAIKSGHPEGKAVIELVTSSRGPPGLPPKVPQIRGKLI